MGNGERIGGSYHKRGEGGHIMDEVRGKGRLEGTYYGRKGGGSPPCLPEQQREMPL